MSVSAQTFYNNNSREYSNSKILPFRCIETYNLLNLVKLYAKSLDESSQRILDVACGDGFYTRKIKELASNCKVIGVDISQNMINIARNITDPLLDIDYIHYDGSMMADLEFIQSCGGLVDHVCGIFFLNYATCQTQLIKYLRSVASILKPGGFFFGLNDNPNDDACWHNQNLFKEIGFDKITQNGQRNHGQPIVYKIFNKDGSVLEIMNYWIPPDQFKEAFEISGFVDFEWIHIQHIPQDIRRNDEYLTDLYGKYSDLFDLMIKTEPVILFKARRKG